ncbi:MAG: hypothetical protein QF579_06880, partial [Dehalococcoidia bacterium]|nr:hypothetical protein [Dehalococcoidia bacterium]
IELECDGQSTLLSTALKVRNVILIVNVSVAVPGLNFDLHVSLIVRYCCQSARMGQIGTREDYYCEVSSLIPNVSDKTLI